VRGTVIAVFLLCLTCALFFQWRGGAYRAEFSGSDEAAHFVTSLMVRDYVASGLPAAPRKFAEDYYVRYPKVAFGIWPPLFHISQAAWMLAFPPSRIAVVVLMAIWSALLALACFVALREDFGAAAAACFAVLLVSLPDVQAAAATDMPDVMMAAFMCAATLFFGRYLDKERVRDSALFGVFAGLAILVKYNALALALVPPFSVLLARRWDLLRRPSFYLPIGVVAALCGPWYVFNRSLVRYAMEPDPGLADIPLAVRENTAAFAGIVGVPLLVLAAVGLWSKFRPGAKAIGPRGKWMASAALLAVLWVFHSLLYPIHQTRYLLAAAPALLLFAAAGLARAFALLERAAGRRIPAAAALGAVAVVYLATTFSIPVKRHFGFSEVARAVVARTGRNTAGVLVSGPAEAEGMLISEMALLDREQHHFVLRASKVLARSTWMGARYRLLYQTSGEIGDFLKRAPVSMVAVDQTEGYRRPHHRLLQEALNARPDTWRRVNVGGPETILIYQRIGNAPAFSESPIMLGLDETLGRSLPLTPDLSSQ
jgi:hypothetical protein